MPIGGRASQQPGIPVKGNGKRKTDRRVYRRVKAVSQETNLAPQQSGRLRARLDAADAVDGGLILKAALDERGDRSLVQQAAFG